jgi:hypothetical protein
MATAGNGRAVQQSHGFLKQYLNYTSMFESACGEWSKMGINEIRRKLICVLLRTKKKKKYRVLCEDRRVQLGPRYLLELENLESAIKFEDRKVLKTRLYSIIRDFFCELLNADRSMTLDEISKKVSRAHIDPETKELMKNLLKTLPDLEYGNQTVYRRDIKKLLNAFRELIRHA